VVPGGGVRAFNHVLGECPVALFGTRALVSKLRKRFPASLNDAPLLLPTENTVLRRSLDQFFVANGIRPRIVAEIEDGALLEALGESGAGVFPAPSIVEGDLGKRAGVVVLGRLDAVRVRLHAISLERKLKHPAVAAIAEHARTRVFGAGEAAST
jgi:LysR family transcriptional activator of nhaA